MVWYNLNMNIKRELIEIIKKFDNRWFNEDQKNIAISIIENAPDKEAKKYFDFVVMKRNTGFAFDYSPEIAKGRIIIPELDTKRGSNSYEENKLIVGDNYNALQLLKLTHKKKIDVIYIDPPYNTDSAKGDGNHSSKDGMKSAKFIYKDKFGRTGWLSMMKDRLEIANELLTDNGVIFASIDDAEQAYLKVLMDDVFGEEKFLASLPRTIARGGKNNGTSFAKEHDYVLVYGNIKSLNGKAVDSSNFKFDDNDGRGKYQLRDLMAAPGAFERTGSQTKQIKFNGKTYKPTKSDGTPWYWRWGEERVKLGIDLGIVVEKNGKLMTKLYFDYDFKQGDKELKKKARTQLFSTTELVSSAFTNGKGSNELKSLGLTFSFPKPLNLLIYLLELIPNNEDITVLDFFAGSGTTGHAVHVLNEKKGTNMKFILCTNNEKGIADKITTTRLEKIGVPFNRININDDHIIDIETQNTDKLTKEVLKGLQFISKDYTPKELELYYDLSALNPLKGEN